MALSAGVKFWRLISAWRQRWTASSNQTETDAARQTLEQDLEDVVGGAAITIENQAQASNPMVFQKPNEPEEPLQSIAW
jgi:hypothetical protein